ncbi:hypothetical protein EDB80DRAFT_657938 [Ilyonectria destructans]|nr:hypothetical protein EDB80DRAFT_657938 [Ilyonectria destructans]
MSIRSSNDPVSSTLGGLNLKLLAVLEQVDQAFEAGNDPNRLARQGNLMVAYIATDKLAKAREILHEVVRTKEDTKYGLDQLNTQAEIELLLSGAEDESYRLVLRLGLALAHLDGGRIQKAIELFEHVALAFKANRQTEEAVQLLMYVVHISKEVRDDARRLASQHELALAYKADAQTEKAYMLLQEVVSLGEETWEPKQWLVSLRELAVLAQERGEFKEAHSAFKVVFTTREKMLEETDPHRQQSLLDLAKSYQTGGAHGKVVKLLTDRGVTTDNLTLSPNDLQLALLESRRHAGRSGSVIVAYSSN